MPLSAPSGAQPVCAAVLAAGASRRLGRPKQLVDHRGEPLVRAIARVVVEARSIARAAVVTGCEGEAVVAAVAGLAVEAVPNRDWSEGMASSVRAATRWARHVDAAALLLVLVDQVRLDAAHIDLLVAAWMPERRTVGSGYAGTIGAPALFDARAFDALEQLEGDRGAAKVLRSLEDVAVVAWPHGEVDLDTPDDLARVAGG